MRIVQVTLFLIGVAIIIVVAVYQLYRDPWISHVLLWMAQICFLLSVLIVLGKLTGFFQLIGFHNPIGRTLPASDLAAIVALYALLAYIGSNTLQEALALQKTIAGGVTELLRRVPR